MAEPEGDQGGTKDSGGARSIHTWTRQILGSIGGLVLATGVLGTAISAYFQQRNWTYQKRADKIDKDSAAAMSALDGLNKIVDEKFLSTYGLDDAIKNRVEGDKLEAAIKRFDAADAAWEQQHQSLASTLEIVVNSQFGLDDLAAAAKARAVDCTRYALDGLRPNATDPLPVRAVLEVIYTCQTKLKQSIEAQIGVRDANGGALARGRRRAGPRPHHARARVAGAERAAMPDGAARGRDSRAAVRRVADAVQPTRNRPRPYAMTDGDRAREDRCLAPYRDDPTFGTASMKPT